VNPHDITFAGGLYEKLLGFNGSDDTVPPIAGLPGAVQGDLAPDGHGSTG